MNYSDRKYRTHINNIIDESLNYVLNEVNNSQNNNNQNTNNQQNTPNYFGNEYRFTKGNWSLDKDRVNQPFGQNDEQGYNINPEDYTIVKINPAKSRWRVVTTKNGYQAWCNIKGHYHPIHYDKNLMQNTSDNFVWFDKCSDFYGSDNPYAKGYGGIFRKKEKRHFAVGLKDNRSFKVYADGEYEAYNDIHNYSETDAQGNKTTGNYYAEGRVNSDGTYTTSFIQDPNNQKEFDPNKFIRVRFDDRSLMQKFYYIWGNTMNNSNRGSNLKAGFNDNDQDQYFFIDMPNGPGIYDYVISLYDNLQNGTIKYNEIDKNVYRDVRSQTPGKRQNPYDFSIPNNPAQYTPIRENIEEIKYQNAGDRNKLRNAINNKSNPNKSVAGMSQNSVEGVNIPPQTENNNTTEEQNKERPEIIVFGNRIEGEDNTVYQQSNNSDIQPGQNDKFYGLYTNPHNQKQFYYRFVETYVQDQDGNVMMDAQGNPQMMYPVYIGSDPYQANNCIGDYSIQTQNDIQYLIINTTQGNIYKTVYPQDINNSKESYPVTSYDDQFNFGTMHLWFPNNNIYQDALLEKQIKKITKQIINEYVYGKKM